MSSSSIRELFSATAAASAPTDDSASQTGARKLASPAGSSAALSAGNGIQAGNILYTNGNTVYGSAAYFQSFDTIAVSSDNLVSGVELALTSGGTVDLRSQLGNRIVRFWGSFGGNDTITTGGGADVIIDPGGTATRINASGGDDIIKVLSGMGGAVDGGEGTDSLEIYENGYDTYGDPTLGSLTLTNIEYLYTNGARFSATAKQFESFATIARSRGNLTDGVTLYLSTAGSVDLADELLGRSASFHGTSGNDVITTSDGNDTITGYAGSDTLSGGAGNDWLVGGFTSGGYGGPFYIGSDSSNDTLNGGVGNDTLIDVGGARTVISGGDGDDMIVIGTGMTGSVDGGSDTDSLEISAPYDEVDLGSLSIKNVENLYTASFSGNGNYIEYRVFGTAAQFESFNTISYNQYYLSNSVYLSLSQAGSVDLADELFGRRVDFDGSAGNDTIITSNGNDKINGLAGNDTLAGGIGSDTIEGGDGDDTLYGGDGDDFLNDQDGSAAWVYGGNGKDQIRINGGMSGVVDGGADTDTFFATSADALGELKISNVENLYTAGYNLIGTAAQFESFTTIARTASGPASRVYLTLSDGGNVDLTDELLGRAVTFTGSYDDDTIVTSNGADTIDGGYGDDVLNGGAGNDTLYGGADNDTLIGGTGTDRLSGGGDDDTLIGGAGADALSGGTGFDTASYAGSTARVIVDLSTGKGVGGDAEGDTLSGIEALIGSAFADTLIGNSGANRLSGGTGDDWLRGGSGADALSGGTGFDTASYAESAAGVTVNLATGKGSGGEAAGDTLSEIEALRGSSYADSLVGNSLANTLAGGAGADTLTGGLGADRFVFDTALSATNVDRITDFTVASDTIRLAKSIFSALRNGPQAESLAATSFRYSNAASTSGGLGEIIYNATTGSLLYDADGAGAGAAVQIATVSANLNLSAGDFRLA